MLKHNYINPVIKYVITLFRTRVAYFWAFKYHDSSTSLRNKILKAVEGLLVMGYFYSVVLLLLILSQQSQ